MSHYFQPQLPLFGDSQISEWGNIRNTEWKDRRSWSNRKATIGLIRSDLTDCLEKTEFGFPIVKAYHGPFPSSLIGLNNVNGPKGRHMWLHGFSDDCVLERIWNRPYVYGNAIKEMGGMLTPDFSLYLHMTPIEKKMNIFRKNAIGQIMQRLGINVIHTLCWAEYDSFEYCIDGVESNGIYAISNIGVNNNYVSRKIFKVGLKEMIRKLNPEGLIVYGYPLGIKIDCEVRVFQNENLNRLHRIGK